MYQTLARMLGKSVDKTAFEKALKERGDYDLVANDDKVQAFYVGPNESRDLEAAELLFQDMERHFFGEQTPVPVPASQSPQRIQAQAIANTIQSPETTGAPQRIKGKRISNTVREGKPEDFKSLYIEDRVMPRMELEEDTDDFDDMLTLAALGSLLTGGSIFGATRSSEDQQSQPEER